MPSFFLTAAETDRFVNVFSSIVAGAPVGSLVAESDVVKIAVASDSNEIASISTEGLPDIKVADHALAAINRDGVVELFESPFAFGSSSKQKQAESLKSRMKQRTRKAKATVKIVRPDTSATTVPLLDVDFQANDLVVVWAEGGVDLRFDRIQWRKRDVIVLEGVNELVRGKDTSTIGAVVVNGAKDMGKMHVDESQAVVRTVGRPENMQSVIKEPEVIDISSAEEETDYEDEEVPHKSSHSASDHDPPLEPLSQKASSPTQDTDVAMDDVDKEEVDAVSGRGEAEEPSFGDLIRANAPGPVDVQAAFAIPNAQALIPASERSLQLPSGMSLGTVLTQSLRTNDVNLLESCLHTRDKAIIRATIERLDSSLASTLLQKLAERFHSRPGRAGSLLLWIQWTIVAHGGYLASQPSAMKTMAALHQTISERARSLPLLLSLKGKLDMLEAQMNLRASIKARSQASKIADQDDEENVIYVEGQEDSEEDSDAEDIEMAQPDSEVVVDEVGSQDESKSEQQSADGDEEEMPTITNGVATESDDEGSESGSEGLIDDEAESTEQDSDDELSIEDVDHEDVDPMESDISSEAEEAPPTKRPATSKLSNGVRSNKR